MNQLKRKKVNFNVFFKLIFSFFIFFSFLFFFPSKSLASDEFTTFCHSTYRFFENGSAQVTQEISLVNQKPDLYVTEYVFGIIGEKIQNVKAWDNQGPLKIRITANEEKTNVYLSFNEKVVGKGATLAFVIKYEVLNIARKEGKLWRVILPKLEAKNLPNQYSLEVKIPSSFGSLAFASPFPQRTSISNDIISYFYEKNDLLNYGVLLEFGDYQIYNFSLIYQLENVQNFPVRRSITLPPDTNYQLLDYKKIEPLYSDIEKDPDGNWVAYYDLNPNQKMDIMVVGKAKIFPSPINLLDPGLINKNDYLQAQRFWEINDSRIEEIASLLKTPKEIYDYVIKTLDYNYDRINQDSKRMGAATVASNPDQALCLEFTDLFVTLARAIGVPSREIEGFAYTTNSRLRPLSLTADILHSWPEYFDEPSQKWKMVDPTWGKTTGGYDYFNNFDMSHFTFVIHGQESEFPLPAGSFKLPESNGKNIFVEFGEEETLPDPEIKVTFEFETLNLLQKKAIWSLIIENAGSRARYNLPVKFTGPDLKAELSTDNLEYLLPYQKKKLTFEVKDLFSILNFDKDSVIFKVGDTDFTKRLYFVNVVKSVLIHLLEILLFAFTILIISLFLLKKFKKGNLKKE